MQIVKMIKLTSLTDVQFQTIVCVIQSPSRFVKGHIANLAFRYCRVRDG